MVLAPDRVRHFGHIDHLGRVVDAQQIRSLLDRGAARRRRAPRAVLWLGTAANLTNEPLARRTDQHRQTSATCLEFAQATQHAQVELAALGKADPRIYHNVPRENTGLRRGGDSLVEVGSDIAYHVVVLLRCV
jgi:hypothetical protein